MSQPPLDPPPLPVIALPPQPDYASLSAPGATRPTVITFIGVISIILACVGILAGLGFGLMDFGLLMEASTAKTMRPATYASSTPAGSTTTHLPERVSAEGFPAADRKTIAAALQMVRPLSAAQLQQLDELLAEHGQAVFGPINTFTPPMLARTVARSGHLDSAGTSSADYFALGAGRLELWDDRAVFFPLDPGPPIRSVAIQLPSNPNRNASSPGLSDDQLRSVFRTINDLNSKPITAAQQSAMLALLEGPGEQIVTPPTDGTDPAWEITSVFTLPDGTLSLNSTHGSTTSTISLASNGSTTQSTFSISSSASAAAFSMPSVDVRAADLTLLLTILQLLLAIFLLVAGILTLRNHPRARRLHWIYVGLKLPLAVMTATASLWMWSSFFDSMKVALPGAAMSKTSLYVGALPAAVACLYPIALIFLLRSRSANRFYSPHEQV